MEKNKSQAREGGGRARRGGPGKVGEKVPIHVHL